MELSRPAEQDEKKQSEELKAPTPLPKDLLKKKTAEDAVADLERRLASLGGGTTTSRTSDSTTTPSVTAPPASAAAPAPAASAASAPAVKGGKNALLARIMAAQERAKQPAATTPPPPSIDQVAQPPPPAFDPMALPPAAIASQPPPPSFDAAALPPPQTATAAQKAPPPSFDMFDPMAPPPAAMSAPPQQDLMGVASAPTFEDLMDNQQQQQQQAAQDLLNVHPVAPPPPAVEESESLESILGALEGLSEEEKQALLAEQSKIMASIEKGKQKSQTSSADARADAFEQRSLAGALQSASRTVNLGGGEQVALHGQERTRQAIQEEFGMTDEEKAQMKADMELAEKLQQEEYAAAERSNTRGGGTSTRSSPARSNAPAPAPAQEQGWMEWLGFGAPAPAPPASAHAQPQQTRAAHRGDIGVSLPPGSGTGTNSRGLSQAQTGSETITFAPSYDSADTGRAEDAALLRGTQARVAEQKPLFNCIADSITSTVNSAATALQMGEDEEGNVHGVDSSGLLAVTTVGRDSNNNTESSTPYRAA